MALSPAWLSMRNKEAPMQMLKNYVEGDSIPETVYEPAYWWLYEGHPEELYHFAFNPIRFLCGKRWNRIYQKWLPYRGDLSSLPVGDKCPDCIAALQRFKDNLALA
jgi:hypothetical protein